MRICTLLPSATEICFDLGLGDSVRGVTHECDFPHEARDKRVVVTSRLPNTADSAEIDRLVTEYTERGESIYRVDAEALREIDPDLIITQDLCHVCAASPDDLAAALSVLPRMPEVLSLNPHSISDVWDDIRAIGQATGLAEAAEELVEVLEEKVAAVQRVVQPLVQSAPRPRVTCLEWLTPFYVGGHWVPEMIALAGGQDPLGYIGEPSVRIEWEKIFVAQPEVILITPCGYDINRAAEEFAQMSLPEGWNDLPAVRQGRVFVSDSNSYFSRPGPRLAEGVAIIARAIHPNVDIPIPEGSLRKIGCASGVSA
jgi:iron complex transport system substrate-binding protein